MSYILTVDINQNIRGLAEVGNYLDAAEIARKQRRPKLAVYFADLSGRYDLATEYARESKLNNLAQKYGEWYRNGRRDNRRTRLARLPSTWFKPLGKYEILHGNLMNAFWVVFQDAINRVSGDVSAQPTHFYRTCYERVRDALVNALVDEGRIEEAQAYYMELSDQLESLTFTQP